MDLVAFRFLCIMCRNHFSRSNQMLDVALFEYREHFMSLKEGSWEDLS